MNKLSTILNFIGHKLPPVGTVAMFAGPSDTIPTGWLFCRGQAVSRTTYAKLFAVIGTTYGNGDGSTTFNVPNLKGKVPVGIDGSQTEFASLGRTGGSKTVALTPSQTGVRAHTHTYQKASSSTGSHTLTTSQIPAHTHGSESLVGTMRVRLTGSAAAPTVPYVSGIIRSNDSFNVNYAGVEQGTAPGKCQMITIDASHTHNSVGGSKGHAHDISTSSANTGSATGVNGDAHPNLQPYIVLDYIIKVN